MKRNHTGTACQDCKNMVRIFQCRVSVERTWWDPITDTVEKRHVSVFAIHPGRKKPCPHYRPTLWARIKGIFRR